MSTETRPSLPEVPPVSIRTLSYDYADQVAAEVAADLDLGSRPAAALERALESRYGIKVWYMDLEDGSAASTVGHFGPAILISSQQAPWRRTFNLAHELFHILTWTYIYSEDVAPTDPGWTWNEKVAQAFAARIVLPEVPLLRALRPRGEGGRLSYGDLVALGRDFDVSTEAVVWRLVTLRRIEKEEAERVLSDPEFRALDRQSMPPAWWNPPPYPERFVRLAYEAYMNGRLSRSVLAHYLNRDLVDLSARLLEYGFDETQALEAELVTA